LAQTRRGNSLVITKSPTVLLIAVGSVSVEFLGA
jgi:hypothetical protein